MPNKKTKKQLQSEGKTKKEIDLYFGINEKTGRPVKWTESKAIELANELIEWMRSSENNMFFELFLVENKDIPREMISVLSKKFKSFFQMVKKAKQIQEYRVAKMGLMPKESTISSIDELNKESSSQKHNSAFCMFFLKAHYGWLEEEKRLKVTQDELMNQHRIEQDQLMNQHRLDIDKKNHEIKLQELQLKKEMAEITKKQHEDDLIHTITFDDSNPIINP